MLPDPKLILFFAPLLCTITTAPYIAELLGISPRTLQRRLADEGTSYSEVVQRVRYNIAAEMLRDSHMRVIDVANALGYEDASNFSRFFRRVASITPRHYRSLYREGEFDYQAAG